MNIPNHVAIILDGNGRWAKAKGMPRNYGHVQGAKTVEQICEDAWNLGIHYLTVYAFSTENWNRPKDEVSALMTLLRNYMKSCLKRATQNNMCVRVIGDKTGLDDDIRKRIAELEEATKDNTGLHFQIAINYGGRDEIRRAVTNLAEQVQAGTLDFARINTSALSSTADEVGVFTLPYIFTSTEQKYKVLDGEIGQNISDSLEKYNIVSLGYWEAGSRNFYTTKKPITCVADMKGMKIRVQQSDIAIKMVETLGAAATPMSYNEVYQGLQTGVIDGAENDFVSYYTSGHYEVAKYFSMDGHMAPPAMLIMSKTVWDKMSENQQNAIQEAAKEAREWQRQAMQDYQEESRKAVEEKGCEVIDVDVKEFQDAVAPMYDDYPQYKDVIEQIRSIE